MSRAIVLPAVVLVLMSAHVRPAPAAPLALLMPPIVAAAIEPTDSELVQLAQLVTSRLAPMPRALVEPLVRWRRDLRDSIHARLSADAQVVVPDLTVLATEPVVDRQSSGFGWRSDPIGGHRKFHKGSDVRGDRGTPVLAAGDGIVIRAERQNGYGNVVFVDHGGGLITRYAHLKQLDITRDTVVIAGEQIGRIGSTGRTTGPHLHFEVRLDGRAIDPVTALTVGELQRMAPLAGRLAALALAPRVQEHVSSDRDKLDKKQSRPERRGRAKRVRPTS
ncbi:MAG: M23 family metallopeptidase [Kofleriaceae bacterium]